VSDLDVMLVLVEGGCVALTSIIEEARIVFDVLGTITGCAGHVLG
jgi:hypothetical protein